MAKTALLLMDLQNGIFDRIPANPEYMDRVKKVETAARNAKIQIIYVSVKFRKQYPEVSANNKSFSALKASGMSLAEGDLATEIHSSFTPQANDILVTKRRVGAFAGSDLEVILRAQQIDHLVLAEIATSGVVLSTLRLAADMDYKITVLADCCLDRDEEVHRVLVEKVFPGQAEVITGEAWAKAL